MKSRIHMSAKPLVLERRVYGQTCGMKPHGLWYGIGYAWHEWVESEMPHWMGSHNYEVNLGKSAILIIDSCAGLDGFSRKYGRGEFHVDWELVSEKYDGIEIDPYQWSRRHEHMWYYGWDIASGCLWNLQQVSIKELEIEPANNRG
jgi:hypothetical protein